MTLVDLENVLASSCSKNLEGKLRKPQSRRVFLSIDFL
jgi:hypothetical protein